MSSLIKAKLFENSAAKCNAVELLEDNNDPNVLLSNCKKCMSAMLGVFVMTAKWHGDTFNFRCPYGRSMSINAVIVVGSALKRILISASST